MKMPHTGKSTKVAFCNQFLITLNHYVKFGNCPENSSTNSLELCAQLQTSGTF